MTEYRVRATGQAKSEQALRRENAHISLPKVWNTNVYETLGIDPITETSPPAPSDDSKAVVKDQLTTDENGNVVWTYTETDKFQEYTLIDDEGVETTVTVQDQIDASNAARTAELAYRARSTRSALLKETDHYGLSDVTMSAEMTAYRQALRDVPQQADFPNTINWPTKPE